MARIVACNTCGTPFVEKAPNTTHINDGVIYRVAGDGTHYSEQISGFDYCQKHTPSADGPPLAAIVQGAPEPDREG